jgi:protein-S-isoprenylcysteine O-methyltransferase Ste14
MLQAAAGTDSGRFVRINATAAKGDGTMHAGQVASIVVAAGTWVGFAVPMKTYFRHADRLNAAKTGLIVAAFVCTAVQIAVLASARPAGPAWFWLGAAGYALANGLFWWALSAHGQSHPAFAFTRVPPTALTTGGPYRVVRHPIYSAYLLAWCAGAAASAQPWLLVGVVCMGLVYLAAARQEEKAFSSSSLASGYADYQRTGMFLPRLTTLLFRS